MGEQRTVRATSLTSFAEAAAIAFEQVPGDTKAEGLASAEVSRAWMTKGGVVGAVQYNVELTFSEKAS